MTGIKYNRAYNFLIFYIFLLFMGTVFSLSLFGRQVQFADIFFVFILIELVRSKRIHSFGNFLKSFQIAGLGLVSLLAWLFLSCIFSHNVIKSLVEFAAILYLGILYIWISAIDFDELQLKRLLRWWVYLSVVLCALTIISYIWYALSGQASLFIQPAPEMKSVLPFARASALFYTPSMFATFLHVGIVFALALILSERCKVSYLFYLLTMLLCAILTESRILLGIFITIFLIILPVKKGIFVSIFKYIVLVCTVLLFIFVLISSIWCVFPAQIGQTDGFSVDINTSPSPYAILNKASLKIIKENFWIGAGPGLYKRIMPSFINWEEAKETYRAKGFSDKNVALDPHNTYLGMAAESGVVSMIIFLIVIAGIAGLIRKGYLVSQDSFIKNLCYVSLCGAIGFMINAWYIDIITMRQFWLMLGLGTSGAIFVLNKSKG